MSEPRSETVTLDGALAVARRLAWGWDYNRLRKSWWRWSERDEMNVRVPVYEQATQAEVVAMLAVLSGRSGGPDD